MFVLRDYQEKAVVSVFDYFAANCGNPLVGMPTGTGKSLVIAEIIRRALTLYPQTRILGLTHVKELVAQNFETLLKLWPSAPGGICSAGLRRHETQFPLVFAGIGSVMRRADELGHRDLVMIDEAHLVSPKKSTQYRRLIATLAEINPQLKVIGFSATLFRQGQGFLTDEGGLFTDTCFDLTTLTAFNKLLDAGWLARLVPKETQTQINTDAVKITAGEFNGKSLQLAADRETITAAAVEEMLAEGEDRKAWLVFASGINHADHVAERLAAAGVPCASLHTGPTSAPRDSTIAAFRRGELRAVVNNGILTTGFDYPQIDMIGMLRPTVSPNLWVQMLGRGTRPAEGKEDCKVLDFAGNTMRLGPINNPRIPKRRGTKPGDMPAKVCPACGVFNLIAAKFCAECGHAFPENVKLKTTASTAPLIAPTKKKEPPIEEWFTVDNVAYSAFTPWNRKRGYADLYKPAFRVAYETGLRTFYEYVRFESQAFNAEKWWKEGTSLPVPKNTKAALAMAEHLAKPARIRVWTNLKNPRVMYREF